MTDASSFDTARLQQLGVPLRQLYGQTEISGISCIHRGDDILFHTVGVPLPGTEIRIADDGEILSRSPAA